MKVIFGSAGFAKELHFILLDSYNFTIEYFVTQESDVESVQNVKLITEDEFFKLVNSQNKSVEGFIGIGNPQIRAKVLEKINELKLNFSFPNALFRDVVYDKASGRVKFGNGNVICAGVKLTTDIAIGDHNHLNLNTTVGHDTIIGNFNTFSPGVHISGNVTIGNRVFFGTGAVILEKLRIADNVIIGAGSVVTKSLEEAGTYVGIPAKRIK